MMNFWTRSMSSRMMAVAENTGITLFDVDYALRRRSITCYGGGRKFKPTSTGCSFLLLQLWSHGPFSWCCSYRPHPSDSRTRQKKIVGGGLAAIIGIDFPS